MGSHVVWFRAFVRDFAGWIANLPSSAVCETVVLPLLGKRTYVQLDVSVEGDPLQIRNLAVVPTET